MKKLAGKPPFLLRIAARIIMRHMSKIEPEDGAAYSLVRYRESTPKDENTIHHKFGIYDYTVSSVQALFFVSWLLEVCGVVQSIDITKEFDTPKDTEI